MFPFDDVIMYKKVRLYFPICWQLVDEQTDFFPVNRALSLSQCEGDQQENRMDALTKDINRLVQTEQQHVRDLVEKLYFINTGVPS